MTTSDKLREIAEKCFPMDKRLSEDWLYNSIQQKDVDTFVSDLTALISDGYVEKVKYDEAVQQRDELKEALVDMVNQFAYRSTYEGRENMHTGGLSALEDAFAALGLSDPITLIDFYAAIKSTER